MGITNFCKLISPLCPPTAEPEPFDVVLVDCQGSLYAAIEMSLETEDAAFFGEICEHVWGDIRKLIRFFAPFSSPLSIVLSFDGDGPAMKHPTQRERRQAAASRKTFFRYVLFGNNTLTLSVMQYLEERLKECEVALDAIIAGCNVPGEGEHKVFHVAEKRGFRRPVVASVDQDVFVLALMRLDRYDSLQVFRYNHFYNVTRLAQSLTLKGFLDVSFLFGNDFIKPLVAIAPSNVAAIQEAMAGQQGADPPATLALFLRRIQGRLRFQRVEPVNRRLLVAFWTVHLWMADYYTRRCFPQLFMENELHALFHRDSLLTGLLDEGVSREAFHEARDRYAGIESEPIRDACDRVYQDATLLARLRAYWQEPGNGSCRTLRVRPGAP